MLEENKIIGVCLFDNPSEMQGGWISLAGEPPKYISGSNALPQKTNWITNVRYNDFISSGMVRMPNIRESHFMRLDAEKALKELGPADANNNMANCVILSEIFNRIAAVGHDVMGITLTNGYFKYHQNIEHKVNLSSVKARQQTESAYIQDAIDNSFQINQGRFGTKPNNSKDYHFTFPRISYYKWLFSKKYPLTSDQFTTVKFKTESLVIGVKNGKKVEHHDERVRKFKLMLDKNDFAYFFKIEISHIEEFHSTFASFSCGAGTPNVPLSRNWASLPEIIELSRFAVVTIFNGYKTPLSALPSEVTSLVADPESDDLCRIEQSLTSKGMFLENVFSMLGGQLNKNNTALGAYLRTYDRMACLSVAEIFHRFGYAVGSYSTGKIILYLKDNEVSNACGLAMLLGMMPPLRHVEKKVIDVDSIIQDIKRSKPDILFGEDDGHIINPNMDRKLQEELAGNFLLQVSKLVLSNGMLSSDFILRFDRLYDEKNPVEQLHKFIALMNSLSQEAETVETQGREDEDETMEVIDM